ncbi:MAG: capsular biosynthesis protein, partial [Flavobacteriales bacterium CG_4_9_14_0_2_um_filter_32_27]
MSKNYENNTIYQHEAEDDFNIKQFFLTYLRFWYVYVFVLSITLSMAYFYNWFAKPVYNVSAKILIKDDKSTSIGTEDILKDLNVYS